MESQRAIVLLAIIILCSSIFVAPDIIAAHPGEEHNDEGNGLSENESSRMWSGDVDRNLSTNSSGSTNATLNESLAEEFYSGTDHTYVVPPKEPVVWNRNDFKDFPTDTRSSEFRFLPEEADETAVENVPVLGNTERNRSVYPPHAELKNGERGWIKDAHATLFTIQPSTRFLKSPNTTPTLVDPNGSALGTVDFRTEVPAKEVLSRTRRNLLTLQRAEIADVCVLQGGDPTREDVCSSNFVIGSDNPSHTPNVTYSINGRPGTSAQISFAAEVEATVRVERQRFVDERGEPPQWETFEVVRPTSQVVVSDTRQVQVYGISQSRLRVNEFPRGREMGVVFSSRQPWVGINLPDRQYMTNRFRFVTARDPRWDELVASSSESTDRFNSSLHPINTYAFPSQIRTTSLPDVTDTSIARIVSPSESPSPEETLPKNVDVPVVNETYEPIRTVAFRTRQYDPESLSVIGMVYGMNESKDDIRFADRGLVTQPNVRTDLIEFNNSHTLMLVNLTDADGSPIMTAGSDAHLTYKGERFNTNDSGLAKIIVRDTGKPQVQFIAEQWWATSNPHLNASGRGETRSTFSTVNALTSLFFRALTVMMLPISLMWFFDKIPGVTMWPPQELLR